jgi:hypothetical protein
VYASLTTAQLQAIRDRLVAQLDGTNSSSSSDLAKASGDGKLVEVHSPVEILKALAMIDTELSRRSSTPGPIILAEFAEPSA